MIMSPTSFLVPRPRFLLPQSHPQANARKGATSSQARERRGTTPSRARPRKNDAVSRAPRSEGDSEGTTLSGGIDQNPTNSNTRSDNDSRRCDSAAASLSERHEDFSRGFHSTVVEDNLRTTKEEDLSLVRNCELWPLQELTERCTCAQAVASGVPRVMIHLCGNVFEFRRLN